MDLYNVTRYKGEWILIISDQDALWGIRHVTPLVTSRIYLSENILMEICYVTSHDVN